MKVVSRVIVDNRQYTRFVKMQYILSRRNRSQPKETSEREESRREERGAARCSLQVNIATTTSGCRSLEFYGSLGSRCIYGSWLSRILAI